MKIDKENELWAKAISLRIVDEWNGKTHFPEDSEKLEEVLESLFAENPEKMRILIGTGIIEENYFDNLE